MQDLDLVGRCFNRKEDEIRAAVRHVGLLVCVASCRPSSLSVDEVDHSGAHRIVLDEHVE